MGYLTNDSSPADILADDLGNRLTDDILIPTVADRVLDFGLGVLADEADKIYICSDEPLTYAQATGPLASSPDVSGFALGVKDFGSPVGAFGPVSSTVSPDAPGRYVASTAITNGSVSVTGLVTHWAAVDSANLISFGLAAAHAVFFC